MRQIKKCNIFNLYWNVACIIEKESICEYTGKFIKCYPNYIIFITFFTQFGSNIGNIKDGRLFGHNNILNHTRLDQIHDSLPASIVTIRLITLKIR